MVGPEITTRTARVHRGEDGIVRVVVQPGDGDTLEDAQENTRAVAEIVGDRTAPLLIDLRRSAPPSQAARRHYATSDSARIHSAVAVLISTPVSRVIGSFIVSSTSQSTPTRLFTSETEAIAWLQGFVL